LVAGAGWLARSVLALCAIRGCAWRAVAPASDETLGAEHLIPSALPFPEALRRGVLPARPDAVILTEASPDRYAQSTEVCRTGGTLVVCGHGWPAFDFGFYPDVHKRGLQVLHADSWGGSDEQASDGELSILARATGAAGVELA
jgi:hypothetical protein